jgi:hypothetical protein
MSILLGNRGSAGPSKQVPALFKPKENKMEMTKAQAGAEIKRLRKQAMDESIPQEARNQMLDKANDIEYKFYEKEKRMAKGGAVKGYMYGGVAKKEMAKGGAVKKAPAKKAMADKKTASKAAVGSKQSPVVAVMIGMTEKKKPATKKGK